MNNPAPAPQPASLNVGDVYYILFRNKWKIILCTLLGWGAALVINFTSKPVYQSEAKLSVQYVISERKGMAPMAGEATKSPDQRGETIMITETEILNSSDLAQAVTQAIGAERILAKVDGGRDMIGASEYLRSQLTVRVPPGSGVIHIVFKHPDAELVQPVLQEIVQRYLRMHREIHRGAGMLDDHFAAETEKLRGDLMKTEDDLRIARNRAGIVSFEDARTVYAAQITDLQRQIFGLQVELAGRTSVFDAMSNAAVETSASSPTPTAKTIPPEIVDSYLGLSTRIATLQKREQELMADFQADNNRVRSVRAQLQELETTRRKLLEEHPGLVRAEPAAIKTATGSFDSVAAAAEIAELRAKLKVLTAQLENVKADVTKLDNVESHISELRRRKDLQEQQYRAFQANLELNRINETLGGGRVSNIKEIQTPSPPTRERSKTDKLVRMIALAGIGLGLAWAFAIEFFFDRSVRRPVDIERLLHYPLLLTIPALRQKTLKAAPTSGGSDEANTTTAIVPAGHTDILRNFHETLRDRLIAYFESRNLTHKPKLVAVSGMAENAGVTTTAAGLARTLSETGEGNVLLVDMTGSQGSAQHFVKGKAACGLDEILDARDSAHVHENLYVVGASDNSDRLYRNLPQRFAKLIPKLKASDFDYVIFDMPPVSQISITPRLASFMDMVLLVVESEKTDREVLQRGAALLGESRAHVAVVLNKLKSYVPPRLQQEMISH